MAREAPLRIAVWHFLPSGGGRRALYQHVKGLVGRGHHVELWCPKRVDDRFLPLRELAEEHVVPLQETKPTGGFREVVDIYRGVRADVEAMDQHCLECANQMEVKGFDALFANTSMNFAVTAIGRFVNFPKVLYLQEPLRELYEASPALPWRTPRPQPPGSEFRPQQAVNFIRHALRVRKLGILVREEQENARAFDRILVNSIYSRESVLRAYGLTAHTCYLGIDTKVFFDYRLERESTVLSVGAIVPAKAIERSIEAVAAVATNRPTLELIGNLVDVEYQHHLRQLAMDRGVAVDFKVNLSDSELVERLNRAAAMIYTPRLEPFGFAPLEAAACGLPVVGIAEGGIRETVRDGITGLLVDDDSGKMAKALERILNDPPFGRQLGASGREWVQEHWTVDLAVDRLEAHLGGSIARKPRGSTL